MKQRFLNQKLGKRMSRKAELQKTKAAASTREEPRGARGWVPLLGPCKGPSGRRGPGRKSRA